MPDSHLLPVCRYLPGVHIGGNVTAYPDLKVCWHRVNPHCHLRTDMAAELHYLSIQATEWLGKAQAVRREYVFLVASQLRCLASVSLVLPHSQCPAHDMQRRNASFTSSTNTNPGVVDFRADALTRVQDAVEGADVLVFCVPHQFAHGVCRELRAVVKPGAIAISLTKARIFRPSCPFP